MKKINLILRLTVLFTVANCSNQDAELKGDSSKPIPENPVIKEIIPNSGDIIGKVVAGYQGWFGCAGDNSPFNSWRHWSNSGAPSPGNQSFELWPDTREYGKTYLTGYANLGDGSPAKLFSNWDYQSIDIHFKWMKEYNIDCAAVQRFGNHMANDPRDKNFKNTLLINERKAAETHSVKFFVMYDISGWTNFETEIKTDWTQTVSTNLASLMYAKQNNKPVVCIWGIGVSGRPGNVDSWKNTIKWFKDQGCYVIIGTARNWRTDTINMSAYLEANMISPWSVGTFSNLEGADNYSTVLAGDKSHCDTNGQDYLPVTFPGFSWSNWKDSAKNLIPRLHGDFMWRQFANIRNKTITQTFIAMFDEYDEGTAIAKAAEDKSMIPQNQYFLTLDADGTHCSSDFYLRLTQDGGKMIKKESPLIWQHKTPFQKN